METQKTPNNQSYPDQEEQIPVVSQYLISNNTTVIVTKHHGTATKVDTLTNGKE
jgi:hypothetical protein